MPGLMVVALYAKRPRIFTGARLEYLLAPDYPRDGGMSQTDLLLRNPILGLGDWIARPWHLAVHSGADLRLLIQFQRSAQIISQWLCGMSARLL
jgi:hypothetical protein